MISDILLFIIAVIALVFASIVDIKIKEVPNWLNYSLITSALAIRLIASIASMEMSYIANAIIIFVVVFVIANLMYRLQIWGGGDSKLLIGVSCVFATKPFFLDIHLPFLLVLITSIFFSGAVYAIIYGTYYSIKYWKKFKEEFKAISRRYRILKNISLISAVLIALVAVFVTAGEIRFMLIAVSLIIMLYAYTWISARAIEKTCMFKRMHVSKLIEGDWVVDEIIKDGKTIYKKKKTGITKRDIENLINHKIEYITVKQGIPFAPTFLFGLIITVIIGLI